jgi:hypothetical protein
MLMVLIAEHGAITAHIAYRGDAGRDVEQGVA